MMEEEDTSKVPVDQLLLQQSRRHSSPAAPRPSVPELNPFAKKKQRWPLAVVVLLAAGAGAVVALRMSHPKDSAPTPSATVAAPTPTAPTAPTEGEAPSAAHPLEPSAPTPANRAAARSTPRAARPIPAPPTPSPVPARPAEPRSQPAPVEPGMDLQGKGARPHRTLDEKDPYAQ